MSQYYKKYMKKREEEKPSYIKLFIGAFLLMAVFFVIVATHLTLSVDTTIGENDEGDIKESGLGVKHLIDSRLKLIQMEDTGKLSIKDQKEKTIDTYNKTIETTPTTQYSGQYQNTYGYNQTQQTQPYSQTYNSTQKDVTVYSVAKPTTAQSTITTKTVTTAPTPTATVKPKTTTPSYQVQKNLAPTGMN
jgi:hypothetical protein